MGLSWQLNWSLLPLVSYASEKGREGKPRHTGDQTWFLRVNKKALISSKQWAQWHIHNPVIYSRSGFLHCVLFYSSELFNKNIIVPSPLGLFKGSFLATYTDTLHFCSTLYYMIYTDLTQADRSAPFLFCIDGLQKTCDLLIVLQWIYKKTSKLKFKLPVFFWASNCICVCNRW